MKKIVILVLAILLVLSANLFALERFDIVTTEEMKQMLDKRAAGKTDFILVNKVDEIIYRHSSIPGSVKVP